MKRFSDKTVERQRYPTSLSIAEAKSDIQKMQYLIDRKANVRGTRR